MLSCPRCLVPVDRGWAYCAACGRPRIVEGLRTPVPQRPWITSIWRGVLVLLAFWLFVTVGVAFIREARALRMGRKLLEQNRPKDAWSLVQPFLEDHPENEQALFLCGKATIRQNLQDEAKNCLARLSRLSPELIGELKKDYQLALTEASQKLGCNVSGFGELVSFETDLGNPSATGAIGGLDKIVDACATGGNYQEISQLTGLMIERGQGKEMTRKGLMPVISRFMQEEDKDSEARWLAELAIQAYPEGKEETLALLEQEPQPH
jgi:hypothetical protein